MLADITVNTETMVVVSAVVGALVTAIVFLFGIVIKSYDARLQEEKADSTSWRQIASEALVSGERAANKLRQATGQPPPAATVIAVVPESSSDPTNEQMATADIQTARAKLAALNINVGDDNGKKET